MKLESRFSGYAHDLRTMHPEGYVNLLSKALADLGETLHAHERIIAALAAKAGVGVDDLFEVIRAESPREPTKAQNEHYRKQAEKLVERINRTSR